MKEPIAPHLVVGQADTGVSAIAPQVRALADLIVALHPRGFYSVRPVEDECGPAIHCAFESEADAARLARTVRAIEIVRYPGFRSERAFHLNDRSADVIDRTLAGLRALQPVNDV